MAGPPIPTWHGGILYRSRLEARYAFFFDRLSIKFEYETQGFETDGERYLPDFVIFAALGTIWAEVKPTWDNDPNGVAKFKRFAAQRRQPTRAALLVGPPAVEGNNLVIGGDEEAEDPVKGPWEDDRQQWRPCPDGHHFDLSWPGLFRARFAEDGCPPVPGNGAEDRLAKASDAARSARFTRDPGTGTAA